MLGFGFAVLALVASDSSDDLIPFSTLDADTLRCEVTLSHVGGELLTSFSIEGKPEEVVGRRYERRLERDIPNKGRSPLSISGIYWPAFFVLFVREIQSSTTPNMIGMVALVPHTNYGAAEIHPFNLSPHETTKIEFQFSRRFDPKLGEAWSDVAQALGRAVEAKRIRLAYHLVVPNVTPEEFQEVSIPTMPEVEEGAIQISYLEEWDRERLIRELFENRESKFQSMLKLLKVDSLRLFFVVSSSGERDYYFLAHQTATHHAFQVRVRIIE